MLVVLDHIASWPAGGFVGVDIFFVISGFLITGLLLDETDRRGRISFRRFYSRRARRILPAALTVLAAIVITAHVVFRGVRFAQTVSDVKWALAFSANIHFARIGTDYFDANRPPSLVQHFWSLAVEEQFYLVWPLLILAVLVAARASRKWLLAVLAVATVASFAYSVRQTSHDPVAAYFSSPGRAWELGAGALVAVTMACYPRLAALFGRARGPVSLFGLAGIVVSAFVVKSAPGFPAPWAALPVLSAVLVVVAGLGGPLGRWGIALTNPASRYVGRISYSLYLWHWPVILVVAALVPQSPASKYAITIFAMGGLSVASYHFVESPARRLAYARSRRRHRIFAGSRRPALATLVCLVAVLVLAALVPPRAAPSFTKAVAGAPRQLARSGPDVAQPSKTRKKAIDAALSATSFPAFSPPLDRLGSARGHWGPCNGATEKTLARCTFGSQSADAKTAVVIGDSIAMSWLPGIEAALSKDHWRIYGLMLEACPAATVSVYDARRSYFARCNKQHTWALTVANRLNPSLVILSSTDDTLARLADNSSGPQAAAEYRAGLQRTIGQLHPSAHRHVVTLSPPPPTNDLALCQSAGSAPSDCVRPISSQWISASNAERAAAAATRTSYRDTHLWFCNPDGFCPAFVGTTVVRWDGHHVTDVYARSLAAEIRSVIDGALAG